MVVLNSSRLGEPAGRSARTALIPFSDFSLGSLPLVSGSRLAVGERLSLCTEPPSWGASRAFLTRLQHALAGNLEGQRLSRVCAGDDPHVGVRLLRVIHGLVVGAGGGGEFHAFRHNRDEMPQRINALGVDVRAAIVGERVLDLELGGSA